MVARVALALGLAAAAAAHADEATTEIAGLPLVGGDTDVGLGAGVLGNVARLDPRFSPYAWNVEFGAFFAFKSGFGDPSYEDAYVLVTVPQLAAGRLRLDVRPSFTKDIDLPYFGLGNHIRDFSPADPARDFFTRIHPALAIDATWRVRAPWYVLGGASYTWNQIELSPTSTLAQDARLAEPFVRDALVIAPEHSVLRVQGAIIYDTRDDPISTYRGQDHQLAIRASPRMGDAFPYGYQQLDAQLRLYTTPIPRYLTLAARAVVDVMFGDPPFYELTRYDDTSAIGGANGVRGVPAYQFYGKVKALANLEARSELVRTRILGKRYVFGVAAFCDAGRLWSELTAAHPELDGTGLGLHWGVGGGLRIRQGRTGVIRADVAWSPDARPVGLYLAANQMF
jgi:hypothetical protein